MDFTEKICHETDKIKELNQNIWDIFDELGKSKRTRERSISDVTKDFEEKKNTTFETTKRSTYPWWKHVYCERRKR